MRSTPLFTRLAMKYIPIMEGKQQVKREICPVAFIDDEVSEWIMLEAICEKYKGAIAKMPEIAEALLDPIIPFVFTIVAETKNKYEMAKLRKKVSEGNKK